MYSTEDYVTQKSRNARLKISESKIAAAANASIAKLPDNPSSAKAKSKQQAKINAAKSVLADGQAR